MNSQKADEQVMKQIAAYVTVRMGEVAKSWCFMGLPVALDEQWEAVR